jgi:serine/threonine-protein kinase RsbW
MASSEAIGNTRRAGAARHPLSDESSLSGIRRMIRSEMSRAGVDPAESFDCLVAVTEACSNALLHGRSDSVAKISWEIDNAAARFYIRDYSTKKWSMSDHPSRPNELTYEENARIGGFGIELMRGLMDEVDISIDSEGTTVALTKNLRGV